MSDKAARAAHRRPTDADARRHVAACLRKNPIWESGEVLSSRAALLRLNRTESDPHEAARRQSEARSETRARLKGIREVVWQKPLDELRVDLKRAKAERFPELRPAVERVRLILDVRERLPRLTTSKDFDADLFNCFKRVVSGTPTESAEMRERVMMSFRRRDLRKRGKKMLSLMEREVPELCALESAWIAELRGQRGSLRASREPRIRGVSLPWWASSWWVWFLGLSILSRLIRALMAGE